MAGTSERGRVKKNNQDHILVKIGAWKGDEFGIFVVADGMGGLSAGEFASAVTIQFLSKWWEEKLPHLLMMNNKSTTEIIESLLSMVKTINQYILEQGKTSNEKMGTTLSLLFLYKNNYHIIHVGDSRIYRIINSRIEQLTKDHSYVGDLVAKGEITHSDAKLHPKRNLLTQCIGVYNEIKLFEDKGEMDQGTGFIICSDGFYNLLEDDEIVTAFKCSWNVEKTLKTLTKRVYERGANDNLSAIIVESQPSGWKSIYSWLTL